MGQGTQGWTRSQSMNLTTGNSGNRLRPAVIKTGPGCQQEGAFCQYLGPQIAPEIYTIFPDGYVMEALASAPRSFDLLHRMETVLRAYVWNRPALPSTDDTDWRHNLAKFSVDVPDWVVPTEFCLVHGDPTASNALIRPIISPGLPTGPDPRIILCDPRAPRNYIPQCRETDMGRILQSYYGWEVAAYGATPARFLEPYFMCEHQYARKAKFWCGAAAARIEYQERLRANPNRSILDWCLETRAKCNV